MIRTDASGFRARLAAARSALTRAIPDRLSLAGADVLADARAAAGFPYDTGSLYDSGAVSPPSIEGAVVSVFVTFGGPSGNVHDPVTYAVPVHEGFDLVAWGHPTGRHIAGRPYLQAPMDEHGPQRLADAEAAILSDVETAWRNA